MEALAKVTYSIIPVKAGMTISSCFHEFCNHFFAGILMPCIQRPPTSRPFSGATFFKPLSTKHKIRKPDNDIGPEGANKDANSLEDQERHYPSVDMGQPHPFNFHPR